MVIVDPGSSISAGDYQPDYRTEQGVKISESGNQEAHDRVCGMGFLPSVSSPGQYPSGL
jgi:hypothetical protein